MTRYIKGGREGGWGAILQWPGSDKKLGYFVMFYIVSSSDSEKRIRK